MEALDDGILRVGFNYGAAFVSCENIVLTGRTTVRLCWGQACMWMVALMVTVRNCVIRNNKGRSGAVAYFLNIKFTAKCKI